MATPRDGMRRRSKLKCNEDEAFSETAALPMAVAVDGEKRQVRWDPVALDVV